MQMQILELGGHTVEAFSALPPFVGRGHLQDAGAPRALRRDNDDTSVNGAVEMLHAAAPCFKCAVGTG